RFLDTQVAGGLSRVLIVVTGDHGVSTAPEEALSAARIPVGRGTDAGVVQAVDTALDAAYGAADWVVEGVRTSPNLYLNLAAAGERHIAVEDVQRTAALAAGQAQGVYVAFSRTQILTGQLPPWGFTRLVVNGFHPRLGGDVYVVTQPGWLLSGPPDASHGSPWAPDTHVPLVLRGPGVTPGVQYRRVTPMDIVPTLAQVLGIGYPTGCVGEPLREALSGS
ncbi:MAG: sulfatase-like hydrolase/transferase, partial [Thermoanaerobaculaceae bacterium]|nr:sulfatase-like hydrolase/transferase [Thermoanaerobaculaceae bacterium]